eukprot:3736981-Rhodomonas_salina.1
MRGCTRKKKGNSTCFVLDELPYSYPPSGGSPVHPRCEYRRRSRRAVACGLVLQIGYTHTVQVNGPLEISGALRRVGTRAKSPTAPPVIPRPAVAAEPHVQHNYVHVPGYYY